MPDNATGLRSAGEARHDRSNAGAASDERAQPTTPALRLDTGFTNAVTDLSLVKLIIGRPGVDYGDRWVTVKSALSDAVEIRFKTNAAIAQHFPIGRMVRICIEPFPTGKESPTMKVGDVPPPDPDPQPVPPVPPTPDHA